MMIPTSPLPPPQTLKLNYLEIHTDLPLWLLIAVHDLLVAIARITGHSVIAFGPLSPKESEALHVKTA